MSQLDGDKSTQLPVKELDAIRFVRNAGLSQAMIFLQPQAMPGYRMTAERRRVRYALAWLCPCLSASGRSRSIRPRPRRSTILQGAWDVALAEWIIWPNGKRSRTGPKAETSSNINLSTNRYVGVYATI